MKEASPITPKKIFSHIGIVLIVLLTVTTVLQVLWFNLIPKLIGEGSWIVSSSYSMWIGTFAPLYLFAVPIGTLMLNCIPRKAVPQNKLGAKHFFMFLLICFPIMYIGNIAGSLLSYFISEGNSQNALMKYIFDANPLKIIVIVLLAPIIEEYIFRKRLLDCTLRFGEKPAILLSGLTFGLFHLNLYQFFYAFGLGMLFAYIYARTGRMRYTIILHSIINFIGSVIAPMLLSSIDLEMLSQIDTSDLDMVISVYKSMMPGLLIFIIYAFLLFGLAIWGLVVLIIQSKRLVFLQAEEELEKGQRFNTVFLNLGIISYIIICLALILRNI